jgi:hypothetical protein
VIKLAKSKSLDWGRIIYRLTRNLPKRFLSFREYRSLGFDPSQRLKWLAFESAVSLPKGFDPGGVMPVVLSRAIVNVKELGPNVTLFGVHKKGMSLLTQLAEMNSFIANHTIVHDDMETAALVKGRNVLIVDDSIHYGRTCARNVKRLRAEGAVKVAVFTAVASRKGLAALVKLGVQVSSVLDAPERLFTLAFGILMVPLLGVFRNGALSNRPYRVYRISGGSIDLESAAYNVLSTIASIRSTQQLCEIPPVDDKTAPVFHGSVELTSTKTAELRSRLGPVGDLDQAKLRVFLSGDKSVLHLCLCGIVWPLGRESMSSEAIATGTDAHTEWLLQSIEAELRASLRKKGMQLNRIRRPIMWGIRRAELHSRRIPK